MHTSIKIEKKAKENQLKSIGLGNPNDFLSFFPKVPFFFNMQKRNLKILMTAM